MSSTTNQNIPPHKACSLCIAQNTGKVKAVPEARDDAVRTEGGKLRWFALYRSIQMHMLFSSQLLSEFCLELLVRVGRQSLEIRPKLWEA